ncbi:hypothetical protein BC830DRAFT_1172313 [Chytriomyces sp. MP71]|nr:hypothetical protein BC830DRAFT_1172313 [Chytriomyces sp. MP71]
MSSKRQATHYLTSENVGRGDDDGDEEPSGPFQRADDEKLKKRVFAAPKKRSIASPAPSSSSSFSGFSFGASSTAIQPSKAFASTSLAPSSTAAVPAPVPIASSKPSAETASCQTKEFAAKVRGINTAFLNHIQQLLTRDPFANISNAAQKYIQQMALLQGQHENIVSVLKDRSASSNSTAAATSGAFTFGASPAVPKPGFSFSPVVAKDAVSPAGGFTFTSASSSSAKDANTPAISSGFTFNATSTPLAAKPTPATTMSSAPGWECDTCLVHNAGDKLKCVACEADKPGASTKIAPPTSKNLFGASDVASSGFSFTSNKVANSAPGAAGGLSLPAPVAASSGVPWECNTCLVQNPADKVKCVACEADKPGAPSSAAPASSKNLFGTPSVAGGFSFTMDKATTPAAGGFSFTASKTATPAAMPAASAVAQWECNTCLVQNPADKMKCVACEADKPGATSSAAPASSKNLFGTPSVAGGFSFTMDKATTPAAGGFSFTASKAATPAAVPAASAGAQWECNTCLVQNPADKVKCVACEADKPGATTAVAPSAKSMFGTSTVFSGNSAAATPATDGFSFIAKPADASIPAAPAPVAPFSFSSTNATAGSTFGSTTSSTGFSFSSINAPTIPSFGGSGTFSAGGGTGFSFAGLAPSTGTPAAPAAANTAANENEEDDEAQKDEQIDPATLMRGAGEADETTIREFRAKAFLFDNTKKAWGNLGLGTLKLNRHNVTGKGRILVRAEGSGRVLVNLAVFDRMGVQLEKGDKSVSFFGVGEGGVLGKYLVQAKEANVAKEFVEEVKKLMQA